MSKLGISNSRASIQIEESVIPKGFKWYIVGSSKDHYLLLSIYVLASQAAWFINFLLKKYRSNYIVGLRFDFLGCRIAIVLFLVMLICSVFSFSTLALFNSVHWITWSIPGGFFPCTCLSYYSLLFFMFLLLHVELWTVSVVTN